MRSEFANVVNKKKGGRMALMSSAGSMMGSTALLEFGTLPSTLTYWFADEEALNVGCSLGPVTVKRDTAVNRFRGMKGRAKERGLQGNGSGGGAEALEVARRGDEPIGRHHPTDKGPVGAAGEQLLHRPSKYGDAELAGHRLSGGQCIRLRRPGGVEQGVLVPSDHPMESCRMAVAQDDSPEVIAPPQLVGDDAGAFDGPLEPDVRFSLAGVAHWHAGVGAAE